jgi:hypothetical protein
MSIEWEIKYSWRYKKENLSEDGSAMLVRRRTSAGCSLFVVKSGFIHAASFRLTFELLIGHPRSRAPIYCHQDRHNTKQKNFFSPADSRVECSSLLCSSFLRKRPKEEQPTARGKRAARSSHGTTRRHWSKSSKTWPRHSRYKRATENLNVVSTVV